jgi:hypothetical protein
MSTAASAEREVIAVFRRGAVKRVNEYAEAVCPRGVELTVLVADGQGWRKARKLDPRVEVLSLSRAENRVPPVWAFETLVVRAPRGVLKRVERRVPGRAKGAVKRVRRVHTRTVEWIRRRLFWPPHRTVRPQLLRRLAWRRLDALDLASARRVMIADEWAVPFGWKLANRYPDLEVTRSVDPGRHEALPIVMSAEPAPEPDPDVKPKRAPYTQI